MSTKRKRNTGVPIRASKQHGSDRVFLDRESGTYFATAAIHQGRVTSIMQGEKRTTPEDAREALNDGLYRPGFPTI